MPRYFFDLHAGSLSEWDDDGHDVAGADEAIALATARLPAALTNNDGCSGDKHAVIMIRDRSGNQIATVTMTGSGQSRVLRPPGEFAI